MKIKKTYTIATLLLAACLTSMGIQAAPRSTPVTVVNTETAPVPVTVQNTTVEPQFVGFSNDSFTGAYGVVNYTNACQASFQGSHMCTSEEFLNTKSYPAVNGSGWIKPTFVPHGGTNSVMDISGVIGGDQYGGGIACRGWSSVALNGKGLAVNHIGAFNVYACTDVRSVACCK